MDAFETVKGISTTLHAWTWEHPWTMLTVPVAVGLLYLADRYLNR